MTAATVVFFTAISEECPKNADIKAVYCHARGSRPLKFTWTEQHPADALRKDIIPKRTVDNAFLIGCNGEISCYYRDIETYYVCTDGNDVDNMVVKMAMIYHSLNINIERDGIESWVEYDGKIYPKFTYPTHRQGYKYSLPGIRAIHDLKWGAVNDTKTLTRLINLGENHDDMFTMLVAKINLMRDEKRAADEQYARAHERKTLAERQYDVLVNNLKALVTSIDAMH